MKNTTAGKGVGRAVDLYAGVGGWDLGLRMSGVDVIASYEWWDQAARTSEANNGHQVTLGDIRQLDVRDVPQDVEFVVGSPPCTQFSYSNRGGTGDIADGLADIEKFLDVVAHVQPRFWAMENVPRVAKVLDEELGLGGSLYRFRDLFSVIDVVDVSEWGVPQRRRRMIAGNFDNDLLHNYRGLMPHVTLGDVVHALAEEQVDPVFGGTSLPITDHEKEQPLTDEELRMNREAKTFHRLYNMMPFPEPMHRPSRTVTATCTRVSRESLIVADDDNFRRLTVRERASLQSFPVGFQFLGDTHSARVKMIGNAIPPLFIFFLGHALQQTPATDIHLPAHPVTFADPVASAVPPVPRKAFPVHRRFASAIPELRFGSGMRVELRNMWNSDDVTWETSFHYGPSSHHITVPLTPHLLHNLKSYLSPSGVSLRDWVDKSHQETMNTLNNFTADPDQLQQLWLTSNMQDGPYGLIDALGTTAHTVRSWLPELTRNEQAMLLSIATNTTISPTERSSEKLLTHAPMILSGMIVGITVNMSSLRTRS